ncbi:hypothetical protein QOT17_012791 [Balamuthia mandrillaris]
MKTTLLVTVLLGLLTVLSLARAQEIDLLEYKRIEQLILSKVDPEVRSLQRQRDADRRELTGLKVAYTQLEAFINNEVPKNAELEVAKKTVAELEKELAQSKTPSKAGSTIASPL